MKSNVFHMNKNPAQIKTKDMIHATGFESSRSEVPVLGSWVLAAPAFGWLGPALVDVWAGVPAVVVYARM